MEQQRDEGFIYRTTKMKYKGFINGPTVMNDKWCIKVSMQYKGCFDRKTKMFDKGCINISMKMKDKGQFMSYPR